jgi:HSP20 family molecular chaperone IbpA
MRNDNIVFNNIVGLAQDIMSDSPKLSKFQKDFMTLVEESSFLQNKSFPVTDTYITYKDKEKKDIEKVQLLMYLAGYRKDDISVEFNDSSKTLIIKGDIKNKKYFPEGENIERLTSYASARKFKVVRRTPNYEISEVRMEDGVLTIDLIPNEDKFVKKIKIN